MNRRNGIIEIVGNILIDITDVLMSVNVCKKNWGEVPLPDSLRKYYEEQAEKEDKK